MTHKNILFGTLALACLISLSTITPNSWSFASASSGLSVTPLGDDYGNTPSGQSAPSAEKTEEVPPRSVPEIANIPSAAPMESVQSEPYVMPSGRDATTLAYLIELARKQDASCPSGQRLPAPPHLVFSEPLCRVARAMENAITPEAAFVAEGIQVRRWRSFSSPPSPARNVAAALRQEHCEALMEPYTHIGVFLGDNGWRIVMAELEPKDSHALTGTEVLPTVIHTASAPSVSEDNAQSSVTRASDSITPEKPVASPGVLPVTPALAASTPGGGEIRVSEAETQRARKLFVAVNDFRQKGGICLGREFPPVSPLRFDPTLQDYAEQAAAARAREVEFGDESVLVSNEKKTDGGKLIWLTAQSNSPASVILDIWMINPSRCEAMLSKNVHDAGVAYANGQWVLLLRENTP